MLIMQLDGKGYWINCPVDLETVMPGTKPPFSFWCAKVTQAPSTAKFPTVRGEYFPKRLGKFKPPPLTPGNILEIGVNVFAMHADKEVDKPLHRLRSHYLVEKVDGVSGTTLIPCGEDPSAAFEQQKLLYARFDPAANLRQEIAEMESQIAYKRQELARLEQTHPSPSQAPPAPNRSFNRPFRRY